MSQFQPSMMAVKAVLRMTMLQKQPWQWFCSGVSKATMLLAVMMNPTGLPLLMIPLLTVTLMTRLHRGSDSIDDDEK
jgi:hypothetical protein